MNKLLFFGLIILAIALGGCVSNTENENNPLNGNGTNTPNAGKLVAGAACEVESDCAYALNAYPIQRCVSANCPPLEEAQPEPGNPDYEWVDAYLDECVNIAQLNGKNLQGEELLIDTRAASCVCEAIALAGTSLDGQNICRKKMTEETPAENTGI